MPATYNILMYSHDTYGLGHIRRTMAIANHLLSDAVNILILTGSPIAGRFTFPEGVDFVRIPGMIKKTNSVYLPHSIKVEPEHALNIRKQIITATAKTFKPSMFIVDKVPLGLRREIIPTLKWFRKSMPDSRVVLGLRDIIDDGESTRKDWKKKNVYDVLDKYYTEIWVYGNQSFYDPVTEYAIPPDVARKICFTGYIPRHVPKKEHLAQVRREQRLANRDKLVVVTTGGGGDGYPVLDNYMSMLEQQDEPLFKTVMVGGPFLPRDKSQALCDRAKRLKIRYYSFFKSMEKLLAAADVVVSMGGYNTVCEILSLKKVSLLIPRSSPRLEQHIRAQVFKERDLLDYIPWDELSPELLYEKILALLENPAPYRQAIEQFTMPGLEIMRARLNEFCEL